MTTFAPVMEYEGVPLHQPYPEGEIPSLESLAPEISARLAELPSVDDVDFWGETSEDHAAAASELIEVTPFMQADLTKDQTERWAFCAGRESRGFPSILGYLITKETNPEVLEIYKDNIQDEFGFQRNEQGLLVPNQEKAHFQHYLRLLGKLGIDEQAFHDYKEGPEIRFALDLGMAVATQSHRVATPEDLREAQLHGLAYMGGNEDFTGKVYAQAATGFGHFAPEGSTAEEVEKFVEEASAGFVDEHSTVDEHHVAELHRAIRATRPETVTDKRNLRTGFALSVIGMQAVLNEAHDSYQN